MRPLVAPGIVVVWSGDAPRIDTYRIPPDQRGFVVGRDTLGTTEPRISGRHARLFFYDGELAIEDLGSRNQTFVARHAITEPTYVKLPAVVRTGHTVFVVVADVRPYEHATISRRGKLVVAGTLAATCRALDAAAMAEDNVVLAGNPSVGRELARSYTAKLECHEVYVDLAVSPIPLAAHLATKLPGRTMILDLKRPLTLPDLPELEAWLETDVRIISIVQTLDSFKFIPKEMTARLGTHVIDVPQLRLDEIPTTIVDLVDNRAAIHASLIESVLLELARLGEDTLLQRFGEFLRDELAKGETVLRGQAFDACLRAEDDLRNCIHGMPLPR